MEVSKNQKFPARVRLLAMCRGGLSAATARLMSKYLWSGWKWYSGVKEIPSPFPCSPVIRECSWKKSQIGKKTRKTKRTKKSRVTIIRNQGFFSFFELVIQSETFISQFQARNSKFELVKLIIVEVLFVFCLLVNNSKWNFLPLEFELTQSEI